MKLLGALLAAGLLQIVGGSDHELPELLFEVFSPRGLKISLPDSNDIKSVEFVLNFPDCPQPHSQELNHSDGRYWVYWNPDVVLRLYDKFRYKLTVHRRDSYWKKEGTHVVQKVQPLADEMERFERRGQKIISAVGGIEDADRGMLREGKSSSLKTFYTSQKSTELKPITKSSMSTTSGTFFIKPSGVMEATGYKKGSSFDSTRREGEQWEHYQSELTAEELENMKNLYGSGFQDFQQFHGSLFPTSGKVYEKSYMSSESKTFPGTLHAVRFGESQPLTTHKFHETHKTSETSSFGQSRPAFQFADSAGGSTFESNSKAEKMYRVEPFSGLPNPLPPQGTIFKATEYVRQEHSVPVSEVTELRETHSDFGTGSSAPQKIIQVSQAGEFSTRNGNHEMAKPQITPSGNGRADQLEYNSGNLQTVERQDYRARHYKGNIFTTVKSSKVKSPQECTLSPGVDYAAGGNVRELERRVYELSCLATLAESTMKEELALLRQKNGELERKLELVEQDVKRISRTCNCYD